VTPRSKIGAMKLFFFKCLVVLMLSQVFGERKAYPRSETIREVLQEANEKIFFPQSIRLVLLKDHPHLILMIAQWQYDDWHLYDASYNLEELKRHFEKEKSSGEIPFTIVALKEGIPIGSISLESETRPEFAHCTGPWVENFHVTEQARNRGIGSAMAQVLFQIAEELGYPQVNFFTSIESNVPHYTKKGAEILEKRPYRGHVITLFKMKTGASPRPN